MTSWVGTHQHTSFGRLTIVNENRIFWKGDVDTRLVDDAESFDGALQFAFERTAVIDVFREVGDAEVVSVEQLEAYAAGLREAGAGQFEPNFIYSRAGDQNRSPIVSQPVLNAGLLQLGDHSGGIFGGHASEQRLEVARVIPVNKPDHATDAHKDGDENAADLLFGQRGVQLLQLIHLDVLGPIPRGHKVEG